jgi:hypothetical protein
MTAPALDGSSAPADFVGSWTPSGRWLGTINPFPSTPDRDTIPPILHGGPSPLIVAPFWADSTGEGLFV